MEHRFSFSGTMLGLIAGGYALIVGLLFALGFLIGTHVGSPQTPAARPPVAAVPPAPRPAPASAPPVREVPAREAQSVPDAGHAGTAAAPPPRTTDSPASRGAAEAARGPSSGFIVQVGVFEQTDNAFALAEALRRRGLNVGTRMHGTRDEKPAVLVWVGPFAERSEAEKALPAIREAGVPDAVVRRVP